MTPTSDLDLSEATRFATYPSLRDRVVLVTGGASGIGASLVVHFCAQAATVAFIDHARDAGERLVAALSERELRLPRFYDCDVRDVAALREVIARVESDLGPISVLVNNAAQDTRVASATVEPELWDDAIAVNLRPHFFAVQAVAPAMEAAGGGSIISLGSVSAHANFVDLAGYIAAKAAIEGLVRTFARELGHAKIRVNCVIPGWIMTERQRAALVTPEVSAAVRAAQGLERELVPADVARLVLWLAADDSAAATGQRWTVDGGWL